MPWGGGSGLLGEDPQIHLALALTPCVALCDVDGQRLLDQLAGTGRLIAHQEPEAEGRGRTRLADPHAEFPVHCAGGLQVRAGRLGRAGERRAQAQKAPRPSFKRPLAELGTELTRLHEQPFGRLAVCHLEGEHPSGDLHLDSMTIPSAAALEQELGETQPVGLSEHQEEQVLRTDEEASRRAGIRRTLPRQGRTDVLAVVAELVDEPLCAGGGPAILGSVRQCPVMAQVALAGAVQLDGLDEQLAGVLADGLEYRRRPDR